MSGEKEKRLPAVAGIGKLLCNLPFSFFTKMGEARGSNPLRSIFASYEVASKNARNFA